MAEPFVSSQPRLIQLNEQRNQKITIPFAVDFTTCAAADLQNISFQGSSVLGVQYVFNAQSVNSLLSLQNLSIRSLQFTMLFDEGGAGIISGNLFIFVPESGQIFTFAPNGQLALGIAEPQPLFNNGDVTAIVPIISNGNTTIQFIKMIDSDDFFRGQLFVNANTFDLPSMVYGGHSSYTAARG